MVRSDKTIVRSTKMCFTGVWTLEKRGEKPTFNTGFDKAIPTYTHRALCKLAENDRLHFVISQNIDGLHHRSGLSLDKLAELHGNVFAEECEMCRTQVGVFLLGLISISESTNCFSDNSSDMCRFVLSKTNGKCLQFAQRSEEKFSMSG